MTNVTSAHEQLREVVRSKYAEIARKKGTSRLAVIAAIGTRLYYEKRGFRRGELYLVREL